jgi:hypothetical protein
MCVEITTCYFGRTMPCWRNAIFVGHDDTRELSKISIEMICGRIKKIKDFHIRWHGILLLSKISIHMTWAHERGNDSSSCSWNGMEEL